MQKSRHGLTLIDVLTAVVMAVLLMVTVTAGLANTREFSYRAKCASNLRQIGIALQLYLSDHGEWPRTRYAPETADRPTCWTAPDSTTPFASTGPALNDVTAAFRLLLAHEDLVPEVFLCPTSPVADIDFARDRCKRDHANFLDERELSYSFVNPYPTRAAQAAGYALTAPFPDTFAVASDVNPGDAGQPNILTVTTISPSRDRRAANSPNHEGDGQNVLYGDGHVEFQQNPFVGVDRDNIFTFGRKDVMPPGVGVVGSPTDASDSVLLPAVDGRLWAAQRTRRNVSWVLWLGVLAVLVVAIALRSRARRASPSAAA